MINKQGYYRLIALWVICEAFLGGMIHGLKLPVSGLVVGSSAVICIATIGYFYPGRTNILRATVIVCVFKMLLSPQSPFPAYIAVLFQGTVAQLIFANNRSFSLKCILFAVLALLESAVQRVLVMTLLFGMDFWKAIDIFISGLTKETVVTTYSYYFITIYILIHFITGMAIGIFCSRIPLLISNADPELKLTLPEEDNNTSTRKKNRRSFYVVLLALLGGMYLAGKFFPSQFMLPDNIFVRMIFRSLAIILVWVVIINPLLEKTLKRWLVKQKLKRQSDLAEVSRMLPAARALVKESWKISGAEKGPGRYLYFFRLVMYNSLSGE